MFGLGKKEEGDKPKVGRTSGSKKGEDAQAKVRYSG